MSKTEVRMEVGEQEEHFSGKSAGRRWAQNKNDAQIPTINRLTKAQEVWDEWFWRAKTYTPSQNVYFVMNPSEDGDRQAARQFWERWANNPDPPREYIEGFVEGALEASDELLEVG